MPGRCQGRGVDNEGINHAADRCRCAYYSVAAGWLHQQFKSAAAGENHGGGALGQCAGGGVPGRDQAALQLTNGCGSGQRGGRSSRLRKTRGLRPQLACENYRFAVDGLPAGAQRLGGPGVAGM